MTDIGGFSFYLNKIMLCYKFVTIQNPTITKVPVLYIMKAAPEAFIELHQTPTS